MHKLACFKLSVVHEYVGHW